jgi:hypothetical protein
MGYYGSGSTGGGTDHTHPNKAVLDQLTSAGSGQVITEIERQAIGRFAAGETNTWSGTVPTTTDEAIERIARLLKQHLGMQIPE